MQAVGETLPLFHILHSRFFIFDFISIFKILYENYLSCQKIPTGESDLTNFETKISSF